jgi:DnaK suppressor protein
MPLGFGQAPNNVPQVKLVGVIGFEPTTSCSQSKRATGLRYTPSKAILANIAKVGQIWVATLVCSFRFLLAPVFAFLYKAPFLNQRTVEMAEDLLHKKQFPPYVLKKGEEYMSAKQLAHFRAILMSLKEELLEDIERTVHTMQDEATVFADPNDRASQESDMALELRNRDRERKLIKKVDESILSIDSGDYGYCESCGVEIGLKRLEARPTATLCIDCKTLEEHREKQIGK